MAPRVLGRAAGFAVAASEVRDARRTRVAREEELLKEARQTTIERSWARRSNECQEVKQ